MLIQYIKEQQGNIPPLFLNFLSNGCFGGVGIPGASEKSGAFVHQVRGWLINTAQAGVAQTAGPAKGSTVLASAGQSQAC
jgi:hypothetical protein